jgi:hypothetical protein
VEEAREYPVVGIKVSRKKQNRRRKSAKQLVANTRSAKLPSLPSSRGALKGTVTIPPGVDITEPAGEIWTPNGTERRAARE